MVPTHRVVLHDSRGRVRPGAVFDGAAAQQLVAQGVSTLPFDPDIATKNAVAGWMMGQYGTGWSFDPYRPTRGAPLVLYVVRGRSSIHYAVRVVPDPQRDRNPVVGQLRLNVDTMQSGVVTGGLVHAVRPPTLDKLTERESHAPDGGWTMYGRCELTSGYEGYLGLSIYGNARNARVAWAAVSQTR